MSYRRQFRHPCLSDRTRRGYYHGKHVAREERRIGRPAAEIVAARDVPGYAVGILEVPETRP